MPGRPPDLLVGLQAPARLLVATLRFTAIDRSQRLDPSEGETGALLDAAGLDRAGSARVIALASLLQAALPDGSLRRPGCIRLNPQEAELAATIHALRHGASDPALRFLARHLPARRVMPALVLLRLALADLSP